ncbi:type II CRISPR RNA-guided endonuclease Cas9 [Chitinophaga tropicalis]|uniref:CRISPR-associated endonuclease Cas9 n=1 Tax=Chitinophaga tropicalis TaxID=2683588 RepID=A0A7K1UCF2_9BACT|nr:type II CRISPR RNA-guided endonuclease Cas9 [Chitinophaga tropicalis]MVT11986.1 type II CRISPR RNA-guided endonuclease Cas9 [Chitinophaga tropicalis]
MKRILGLDLGTNSIGWALIELEEDKSDGRILGAGSRIIPMSQDVLSDFGKGQSTSPTAERTKFRSARRLIERFLLRRERLHRVLNILGFLPSHYKTEIDFDRRLGQFLPGKEPKLAYDKGNFIFKESFKEMLQDFAACKPELVSDGKKIPYDWTIYYLRKKALTQRIEKEEIAWLLLNFNQKRGYNQLRGEEAEETQSKKEEFYSLRVVDVVATGERKGNDEMCYNVVLENGWIYRRTSRTQLDWIGKVKEFIVTTELNEDGTIKLDKEGKEKRSLRAPEDKDWTLVKKKTEYNIDKSKKTIGAYIYDNLLDNPVQKIRGKLVSVVERRFYKTELESILKKQEEFYPELRDGKLYRDCLEELYQHNDAHKKNIAQKGFNHLFINDIIFYQRPLKSKKSLISNCKFEHKRFIKDGKTEFAPLKCIAKSHPLFQEFRLWEFIQNLRIYQNEKDVDGRLAMDVNVTDEFFKSEDDWVRLFEWLNERKDVDQKALLKQYLKIRKLDNYRWNYVVDKPYPCNETRSLLLFKLSKVANIPNGFLNKENEEALWHILYSVIEKNEIQKALKRFASKKGLGDDFVEIFQKFPAYEKEYGSYSAKAIKKLLPLMRRGKYWNQEEIDVNTKGRIEKIITGEYDEKIRDRVRDKAIQLSDITHFRGLPHWLVSYIVYDRHSEDGEIIKWQTAADITLLPQYSLRNPIVEQVINESLLVVRDIWNEHGGGEEGFFDEIHIELGREMKNPADKRKRMTDKINENENTNLRIKALLMEFMNDGGIENVRPYSPMQQEILKIYEEGVLNGEANIPDDIVKISKQAQPGKAELVRYKLWLQQKYRSPYTGMIIPLNKLFTSAYEIEHIIPQSRYFDDSFSNKVICESEVNKDKDNRTAYEYIKADGGKKVQLSFGREVSLLSLQDYEALVKDSFSRNRGKMNRLLMEDIPESFIQRQLNDSRYISKVVKSLMSRIVREEGEQEAISKKVIVSNGSITSTLRNDWGLNDIWNEIITPRFERMNELTNSQNFGEWTNKDGKRVFQTSVPIELSKGFSKKRIDHRHHALDAIVIACCSRNHINYLNNESALGKGRTKDEKDRRRYDLKNILCSKKFNNGSESNYKWVFNKPWDSFTQEVRDVLLNTVISFKQNLRVLNKTKNYHQAWRSNGNGKMEKKIVLQLKGENLAIRRSLHQDTV